VLKRLLPLIVLGLGLCAFFALGLHRVVTFDALREHRATLAAFVEQHYAVAVLIAFVAYALAVAFSLPIALLLTPLCGFLFGVVTGAAISIAGATIGSVAIFLAARSAFAALFRAKAGGMLQRMEEGFRKNAFSYLLFLRLVPVFPFWLVNVVPAMFGMALGPYMLATALGIIPGAVVYASVGAGLGTVLDQHGTPDWGIIWQWHILLPILGLAALALVPVAHARWKARRGSSLT
jgi:uncharacterized membrane protein YdjX (TVP38/TMEM64 family)